MWRLMLEIVNHTFLKFVSVTHEPMPGISLGLDRWLSWDGKWYYSIFERGYTFDPLVQGQSNVAFFPGFPSIIQAFSSVTRIDLVYSGLIVNFILVTFSAYFIYRTTALLAVRFKLSPEKVLSASKVSVLLFLVFPSSLFLAAFYAESLLIFGISGAVYYALRNKLFIAAIFAGIASSAKILGLAAAPTVILIYLFQNLPENVNLLRYLLQQVPKYVLAGLIGISGAIGYMVFLYLTFGDPLLFTRIQTYWGRELANNFIVNIWDTYYVFMFSPAYFGGPFNYIVGLQAMLLPIIAIVSAAIAALRYRMYWLLALVGILVFLPASTSTLISMNRYVYAAVPLFCVAAILMIRQRYISKYLLVLLLLLSCTLLLYLTAGFLSANYFAG